jgi:hypothetical protein
MTDKPNAGLPLEVDPLDQDTGGIDIGFPLIPAGLYDMEITDVTVEASKNRPDAQTMSIKFALTQGAVDVKGETVNKGFPVRYYIGLTPTEAYAAKDIAKKLATVLKHAGFATGVTPRQFINDPKMVVGKVLRCKVVVTKATEEYDEGNAVKSFVDVQ